MGYKFKPNKGVAKRFRATRTGKLKHRREKSTHLRSGRTAKTKRQLGRPAVLFEGHARNMRRMMGVDKLKPARAAHEKSVAAASSKQDPTSSPRPAGTAKPSRRSRTSASGS